MTSERLDVATALPAYRVSATELPESMRLTDRPRGALCVVDGAGAWWRRARDAAAAGARSVLVDEPAEAPLDELAALRELAVPVMVARSRLRSDVVADAVNARAGATVRAVTVDGAAGGREVEALLRDAIGWARVLAGGPLVLRATRSTDRAASGLLALGNRIGSTPGDPVIMLTVGRLADVAGAMLRVDVLGETRTEVTVDDAQGAARIASWTHIGRLEAPPRYESTERAALRRAIGALLGGGGVPDVDDLAHDADLATRILDERLV